MGASLSWKAVRQIVLVFYTTAAICLGAPASPLCPVLIERLAPGPGLVGLISSRAFRRYYGDPELRPIVDAIAGLKSIRYAKAFELEGSAREEASTLHVVIDGITPPWKSTNPGLFSTLLEMKGAQAGMVNPYHRPEGVSFALPKAMTAVVEGIEARLAINPRLNRIVIQGTDVANMALRHLLEERFGFRIVSWKTGGMVGSLTTMRLELELGTP